jgi:hypothetical protein
MDWRYGPPLEARLVQSSARIGQRWEVDFGAALVGVDPETGDILSATDFSKGDLLRSAETTGKRIGEQEARQTAERVLDLVGRPADLQFEKSFQRNHSKEWRFLWARTFQGIPYLYDKIQVRISPLDGKMLGYGRQFVSAPPPSAQIAIEREDAISAARGVAASLGIAGADTAPVAAEVFVVQPDNYWGPGPATDGWGRGAPSRVAWVVRLGDECDCKEFWIDAAEGSLLGGTQTLGPSFTRKRLGQKERRPTAREAAGDPAQGRAGSKVAPVVGVGLPVLLLLLLFTIWYGRRKGASAK